MPFFLRKIRQPKWFKHEDLPWLPEDSLQADALGDLNTKDNRLSVWHIQDDKANLEQVVIALAAIFQDPSHLDCALFDQQLVSEIDVKIEDTRGESSYEEANVWHRDLAELSAEKLMQLATIIMRSGEKQRFPKTRVLDLVKQAVDSGSIDREKLKPNVRVKIDELRMGGNPNV